MAYSRNVYRSSLPETRSPVKRKKNVWCKSRYGKVTNMNDQLEQLEKLDPKKLFKDQETLFVQKLQQCRVLYDFDNPDADVEGKQLKYMILRDIMDYLIQIRDTLSAAIHQEIIGMVSCNLFYSLPSVELTEDERKEDGLVEDVAWPHLSVVYQVFHIFLYHSGFVPINAQYLINKRYLSQLFHLLSSEDKRERVAVRKILVAIYNQFPDVQQFIRKEICYIFLSFIYEGRYCNGIPQLLQMMVGIIEGCGVSIEDEYYDILWTVLLPLHKCEYFILYYKKLTNCIIGYIKKYSYFRESLINEILIYWPKTCTEKEIMFLDEIEMILERIHFPKFFKIQHNLLQRLHESLAHPQFQVSKRALSLWKNKAIVALVYKRNFFDLPDLISALYSAGKMCWHLKTHNISIFEYLADLLQSFHDSTAKLSSKDRMKLWKRCILTSE